ncbi:MAG TPA: hypothetical protein VLK84_03620 [Longimicrobium sp.]|nr:hypothetical protein [Longimicrobium sp.]
MYEDLFRTVQEATEDAYDVLGELGHDEARIAYLARDLDTGTLVVLALAFDGDEIEVIPRLGPGVPVIGSLCLGCGSPKEGWGDRCAKCDARGYGAASIVPDGGGEALLGSVRSAAAGTYDVLGALERTGGSPIYFARENGSGRLVGLALQQDPGEREGFALVLAWEGPHTAGGAQSAAVVDSPRYVDEPAIAYAEPWRGEPDPDEITDPMLGRPRADVGMGAAAAPAPASRRRLGLLTAGGIGVVVLGGLALFALQGTGADQRPAPEPTTVAAVPPAPAPDTTPVLPAVVPDTPASRPEPRPEPRERRERTEPAKSNRSARVIIDGRLPAGWSWSANGASGSGETVELRARRPTTITVDAPGFCTESRSFQLSPGEEYRWVLAMRERPLVGEC